MMSRTFAHGVALVAFALATGLAAAQFTPGTLSVLRVNARSATTTATSASIVEINKLTSLPTGYSVDLATPTAVNTAIGITLDWKSELPTQLRRSTDGTALTFPGYSNLVGASISSAKRNFGTVTAGGTASYQTSTGPLLLRPHPHAHAEWASPLRSWWSTWAWHPILWQCHPPTARCSTQV